jgi:hypothetical protein
MSNIYYFPKEIFKANKARKLAEIKFKKLEEELDQVVLLSMLENDSKSMNTAKFVFNYLFRKKTYLASVKTSLKDWLLFLQEISFSKKNFVMTFESDMKKRLEEFY